MKTIDYTLMEVKQALIMPDFQLENRRKQRQTLTISAYKASDFKSKTDNVLWENASNIWRPLIAILMDAIQLAVMAKTGFEIRVKKY